MDETKGIKYYEQTGGKIYGPGNWPQEWLDEEERKISDTIDDCIKKESENKSNFQSEIINYFLNGIKDPTSMEKDDTNCYHGLNDNKSDYTNDMIYNLLEPRFKWFKPPLSIKIFKWEISMMWAYKIHKSYLLKNCYPVAMDTDMGPDLNPDHNPEVKQMMEEEAKNAPKPPKEFTLYWKCQAYNNSAVMNIANELSKYYTRCVNKGLYEQESLADDYDGDYIYDKSIHAYRAPKYDGEVGDNPCDNDEISYRKRLSTLLNKSYLDIIFNKECELLEGNPHENIDDEQYSSCYYCHRFEICMKYYLEKENKNASNIAK